MTTVTTVTMPARRWGDEPRAEHPAPEVPCRDATEDEIPAAAKRMRTAALAAGWEVRPTYARGTQLLRTGKPGKVRDSLALRLRRDQLRAFAIWVDGKFDIAMRWRLGQWPTKVGARELTAWLVTP